jgi:hypothetical protein
MDYKFSPNQISRENINDTYQFSRFDNCLSLLYWDNCQLYLMRCLLIKLGGGEILWLVLSKSRKAQCFPI